MQYKLLGLIMPFVLCQIGWAQAKWASPVLAGSKKVAQIAGEASSKYYRESIRRALSVQLAALPSDNAFFQYKVSLPPVTEVAFRPGLTEGQLVAARSDLASLQKQFTDFRRWIDTKIYYLKRDRQASLDPRDQRDMLAEVNDLQGRISTLKKTVLSEREEPSLTEMSAWLDLALENMAPGMRGLFAANETIIRTDRKFLQEEFFLHKEPGKAPYLEAHLFQQKDVFKIPKELQEVAVLNDDPVIGQSYMRWQEQGLLPGELQVHVYRSIDELLKVLSTGKKYDFILTDLRLGDGGGRYLVSSLRAAGDLETPILGSSSYSESQLYSAAQQLFNEGFDGFFSSAGLPQPGGHRVFLQALENYFYLRDAHHWSR